MILTFKWHLLGPFKNSPKYTYIFILAPLILTVLQIDICTAYYAVMESTQLFSLFEALLITIGNT